MDKAIEIKRRAQRFILNGDLDGALAEYEKLVSSGDSDPYSWVLLADLLYKKGNAPDAQRRYLEAVDGYEKNGLYKNGIAVCKKMARLSLAPLEVGKRLASLYTLDGLASEAVLAFQHYAELLVKHDRLEEARDALVKAGDLSPDSARSFDRLAEVEVLLGNPSAAATAWREAAARFERGGHPGEAKRCLTRLETLDQSAPDARTSVDASSSAASGAGDATPSPGDATDESDPVRARAAVAESILGSMMATPPGLERSSDAASADGSETSVADNGAKAPALSLAGLDPVDYGMLDTPAADPEPAQEFRLELVPREPIESEYDSGDADQAPPMLENAASDAADPWADVPVAGDAVASDEEPAAEYELVAEDEAAVEDESTAEDERAAEEGPAAEYEPAAEEEEAAEYEPAAEEEAAEYEPAVEEEAAEYEPAVEEEPAGEYELAVVEEPAAEYESAVEDEPAAEYESAAEQEPAVEYEPVTAQEPAEEPTPEPEPVAERAPEPEPAAAAVPSAIGIERFGDDASPNQPGLAFASEEPAGEPGEDPGLAAVSMILGEAQAHFHSGNRDAASMALMRAAQAYDRLGRYDSAAAIYRSLGHSPDVSLQLMMLWLKNCQRRDDRSEAARVACDLGDRALNDGDVPGARDWFERAQSYDPGNDLATRRLKQMDSPAEGGGVTTLASDPAASQSLDAATVQGDGFLHVRTDHEEPLIAELGQLIEEFRKAIEPELESDPQANYDLAVSYREMGLVEEAVDSFRRAAADPAFRLRAGELAGRCLLDLGRFDEAADALHAALSAPEILPSAAVDLRYQLGLALEAAGRGPEALAEFERVYAAQASYPDVAMKIRVLRKSAGVE